MIYKDKDIYATFLKMLVKFRCVLKNRKKVNYDKYDIVFFIAGEKFTYGYISFMKKYFSQYKQLFITTESKYDEKYKNIDNVVVVKRFNEALMNSDLQKILKDANKLIYSGVFDDSAVALIPEWLLGKTYFQFWGADFYRYRETSLGYKRKKRFEIFKEKCQGAAGLIFLIYGEDIVFQKIVKAFNPNVFVAPVPGEPGLYNKLLEYKKQDLTYRIIIGNSATETNHHIEIMDRLKNIKDTTCEIHCPLAYGDEKYGDKVIDYGVKTFGKDMFFPLRKYMPLKKYFQYLSNMDVAIFNNDRQQAIGNIEYLMLLGKKVYLNPNTSMYEHYRKIGCYVYNAEELGKQTLMEIMEYPREKAENNRKKIIAYNSDENFVSQWKGIYEDIKREKKR